MIREGIFMIKYTNNLEQVTVNELKGFFVGWPNPPSNETFYRMLEKSAYIWLAIDEESGQVVGFINAISDFVLSSYIPLLEVLPNYQGKGIGKTLLNKMIETLSPYYVSDLLCDPEKVDFYEKFGMIKAQAMMFRRYDKQNGVQLD
jgi:GNAT superfamily N-acetyltransferase